MKEMGSVSGRGISTYESPEMRGVTQLKETARDSAQCWDGGQEGWDEEPVNQYVSYQAANLCNTIFLYYSRKHLKLFSVCCIVIMNLYSLIKKKPQYKHPVNVWIKQREI